MRFLLQWPVFLLAVTILFALYMRVAEHSGFLDNLVSSMIALAIGIPVAIQLNKYATHEEDKKVEASDCERERKILSLLRAELQFCYSDLFLANRKGRRDVVQGLPYKTELWEVFSLSGQLSVIKDPVLLNRISSTYYIIKEVQKIENMAFEAVHSATVDFGGITGTQRLINAARAADERFEVNLVAAIKEINDYLGT